MIGRTALAALGLATLFGCGGGGGGGGAAGNTGNTTPTTAFTLASTSFASGASIPNSFRCTASGGAGNLPQLNWSNTPTGTKSLVIIMDDEDAVAVQGSTYTHYFALIPREAQLNAISSIDAVNNSLMPYEKTTLTAGTNWVVLADLPPCNPTGTPHTYRWTAYALNTEYNSIATMKAEFDPIITAALNSSSTVENLNSFVVNGMTITVTPKFTRASFEASDGSFIIQKSTFSGRM